MSEDYQSNRANFKNISTLDCLRAYDSNWVWRPNLFMVTSSMKAAWHSYGNETLLAWVDSESFTLSMCERSYSQLYYEGRCSDLASWTQEEGQEWSYRWNPNFSNSFPIEYCIFNPTVATSDQLEQQKCHLQCSPTLLLGKPSPHTRARR